MWNNFKHVLELQLKWKRKIVTFKIKGSFISLYIFYRYCTRVLPAPSCPEPVGLWHPHLGYVVRLKGLKGGEKDGEKKCWEVPIYSDLLTICG